MKRVTVLLLGIIMCLCGCANVRLQENPYTEDGKKFNDKFQLEEDIKYPKPYSSFGMLSFDKDSMKTLKKGKIYDESYYVSKKSNSSYPIKFIGLIDETIDDVDGCLITDSNYTHIIGYGKIYSDRLHNFTEFDKAFKIKAHTDSVTENPEIYISFDVVQCKYFKKNKNGDIISECYNKTRNVSGFCILHNGNINESVGYSINRKDPGTATILSFLLPGGGQFYNEEPGKGICFMLLYGAGMYMVYDGSLGASKSVIIHGSYGNGLTEMYAGCGISLVTWIWSMVEASSAANEINRRNGISFDIQPYYRNESIGIGFNYKF